MAPNLPSCFSIQFLAQLLKFLVNFTLLKYVKSQRSYGFLITKELIFGFRILDLKDHFSASLIQNMCGDIVASPYVLFSQSDSFVLFAYSAMFANSNYARRVALFVVTDLSVYLQGDALISKSAGRRSIT